MNFDGALGRSNVGVDAKITKAEIAC